MNSPTCFISRVPDNGHRLGTLVLVISAELVVLCPPTQSRFRYVWTCPLPVSLPACLGRTRCFVFYSLSSDHTGTHFATRNLACQVKRLEAALDQFKGIIEGLEGTQKAEK